MICGFVMLFLASCTVASFSQGINPFLLNKEVAKSERLAANQLSKHWKSVPVPPNVKRRVQKKWEVVEKRNFLVGYTRNGKPKFRTMKCGYWHLTVIDDVKEFVGNGRTQVVNRVIAHEHKGVLHWR